MKQIPTHIHFIILLLLALPFQSAAQENIAPLRFNPFLDQQAAKSATRPKLKTTALSLPFFEDFTDSSPDPDTNKWNGRQVYINNTMGDQPISRGIATFDALSQFGMPYDTLSPGTLRYADSLTSKVIDLSTYTAADSIYISFFFQPGGIGFGPEKTDSLMLYFKPKTSSVWTKVWSVSDSGTGPFKQAIIAIKDPVFLHNNFQFRFVNKASIGVNDDVWNLDYIRIDAGRTFDDTLVNDIAYTQTPGSILGDYVSMPYRQYLASPAAERATDFGSIIRNNYLSDQTISDYGYQARLLSSGISLASDAGSGLLISGKGTGDVSFSTYSSSPAASTYDRVVFQNKYYCTTSDLNKINDTIIGEQVFDNYLAYDDGTAEMSYFLNLFPTLPGKLAIEHHLNQADTLRGLAIYFGRQVPTASNKYFSIEVYSDIAYGGSTTDDLIYREENLTPSYIDTINHFFIYKFETPVALPAGTFYVGTTQPALSGSDSLYFGLDRNRKTGNHAYYNVLNYWVPSTISGAIMIRPLLGQYVSGSNIDEIYFSQKGNSHIWPNPAQQTLHVELSLQSQGSHYSIMNALGQSLIHGDINKQHQFEVNIQNLIPGIYTLQIFDDKQQFEIHQFQKQ